MFLFLAYFFEQFGKSAFRMSAHPGSGEVMLASDSTQPSGGITSSDGLVHFELGRNKLVRNKLERNKLEINSVLIKFDIA